MINVTLLGTAALMPLPDRALSAATMSFDGHTILFDCGEGTQTAARKCGVSLMKVELIALTHYHGDHINGIPGLLQSMGCFGRTEPLTITGPSGLRQIMKSVLEMTGPQPYEIKLVEFLKEGMKLDGWANEVLLSSFETNHRVTSIGYKLEIKRPGKFNKEEAEKLAIPQSYWGKLQHGETIDGFTPQMVLGQERKGIKVIFTGDTMPCDEIIENAKDADLMICDATYGEDEELAKKNFHCSFSQAEEMADKANVKRMWLTHYSQVNDDPENYPHKYECGYDGKNIVLEFED